MTAVSASTSCSKGTKSFPSQSWFLTVWEGASCIAAKRNRKSKERIRRQRGKTSGFSAPTARRQRASASLSCAACRRRRERALTFCRLCRTMGVHAAFRRLGSRCFWRLRLRHVYRQIGQSFSVYCEIVDENTVRIYGAAFGEMWLTADFLSGTFELYDQAPAE